MKFNFKSILFLVLIIVGMIISVSLFSMPSKDEEPFEYSDVQELFEKDRRILPEK